MPILHDCVLDSGLSTLRQATALHICSGAPEEFAQVEALSLGSVAPAVGRPEPRLPGGRKVIIAPASGLGSAAGEASHYALIDAAGARLLASHRLASPMAVAAGRRWELGAIHIGIPGV